MKIIPKYDALRVGTHFKVYRLEPTFKIHDKRGNDEFLIIDVNKPVGSMNGSWWSIKTIKDNFENGNWYKIRI